jgi:hypothetical protein
LTTAEAPPNQAGSRDELYRWLGWIAGLLVVQSLLSAGVLVSVAVATVEFWSLGQETEVNQRVYVTIGVVVHGEHGDDLA